MDEHRIDAYADYGLAVKRYMNASNRIAGHLGHKPIAHPISLEDGRPELAQAEVDRAITFERILLLADQPTIEAAREWHKIAWELAWMAEGVVEANPDTWRDASHRAGVARQRYYECARRGLHLPSNESMREGPWAQDGPPAM